jgi:hypothetical protein
MTLHTLAEDLRFSLELLIARSTYDLELRDSLLNKPEETLIANNIYLPVDFQILFTEDLSQCSSPGADLTVLALPLVQETTITSDTTQLFTREPELSSSGLNSSGVSTITVVATTEAEVVSTTAVQTSETATTSVEAVATVTTESAVEETTVFTTVEAVVVAT